VSERVNELLPAADGVRRGGGRSAGLRLRGSRNLRLHALLTALLLALGVLTPSTRTAQSTPATPSDRHHPTDTTQTGDDHEHQAD
jgi:hypothetical protein